MPYCSLMISACLFRNVSLESSCKKVGRCVYTSTLLLECGELGLKPVDRLSTDFYITDKNSDTLRKVACLVYLAFARSNDVMVITPPQELISTGCQWKKLLLPVDVDGLILAIP
ncbi:hypothetical protein HAX54_040073 [Datura stramonium]|uniref:Uncharacterized protein n=1 Tax=Datura stramonium TaxID=4076 RepID=A0ABS8VM50_DATST|nr:hypothetical protein [Datura stramonium]